MNNRTEAKLTDLSGMQKAIEEILKQAWERGRKYGQNEDRLPGDTYTKDDMTREYLKGYNDCKDMNARPQIKLEDGEIIDRIITQAINEELTAVSKGLDGGELSMLSMFGAGVRFNIRRKLKEREMNNENNKKM